MCWHLTVAVPQLAVSEVPALFAPAGGAISEADPNVARAVGSGDPCFAIGLGCACSLYRPGKSDANRIREKAARGRWSAAKLTRALVGVDDWSGLAPTVRKAVATVADKWGRAAVFLYWDGRGGSTAVKSTITVSPKSWLSEKITEGQLVVVAREKD